MFIFDKAILDQLEDKTDRRVEFIHHAITDMQQQLQSMGSSMEVYHGFPAEVFAKLIEKYSINKVFTNHDYEPYAQQRDAAIQHQLNDAGVSFRTFKDQVIFEKDEVLKDDGKPYTVFTPYSRKWKAKLNDFYLKSYPVEKYNKNFYQQSAHSIPTLTEMGFTATGLPFPSAATKKEIIAKVKASTGGEVILKETVDANLIGGFILTVGDQQFDSSISSSLNRVKKEFAQKVIA